MHSITTLFLVLTVLVVLAPSVHAFGAGDIPDFAYLEGKAFRHGDIESILEELAKTAGVAAGGSGFLGFASSVLNAAKGGSKFSKMDVKRVYFGNWLRDYSQAMDIAGLSKLSPDTIVMIISILGFMTFGFATEEFEVTADRLGVYLPVEHIDNPKGYAEKEGDARQFHPKLRPPVDPRELEIDERTGMKKYIATENEGWDTSTAHIRRTFEKCINHGRRARGRETADLWEAYRLLGTGLHTMEDLLAHSNWCELALRRLGHEEVFCHVGENVIVNTPNGPAPPLITGTFGSADFIHSLMGEATDHLSEASVTDLYAKMDDAGNSDSSLDGLLRIFKKLPLGGSGDDDAQQAEDIKNKAYNFDPDAVAPKEVQEQLFAVLKWRDGIFRDITTKIQMIPGLEDLIDQLTNALNAYVYTVLAPWLTPILKQATGVLGEGSKAVIDSDDQYAVFDDPDVSDPSHSLLSKDHFGLILNEPAGKIAKLVVEHTVNLIVKAWFNDDDPRRVIDEILEAFHHPYYATGSSQIQRIMMDQLERWLGGLGEDEGRQTLQALTKESVRNGKNKRLGSEGNSSGASYSEPVSGYGSNTNYGSQGGYVPQQNYETNQGRRYNQQQGISYGGVNNEEDGSNNSANAESFSQPNDENRHEKKHKGSGRRHKDEDSHQSYGGGDTGYYNRDEDNQSGRQAQEYDNNYDSRSQNQYGGETGSYDRGENDYGDGDSYSRRRNETQNDNSYGHQAQAPSYDNSFAGGDERQEHHGRRRHDEEPVNTYESSARTGYQPSYQPSYQQPVYGGGGFENNEFSSGGDVQQGRGEYGGGNEFSGENEEHRHKKHHKKHEKREEPDEVSESYDGGYGGRPYGGNDETFGAERLNLEDREESHGGRHRRRDDYYE